MDAKDRLAKDIREAPGWNRASDLAAYLIEKGYRPPPPETDLVEEETQRLMAAPCCPHHQKNPDPPDWETWCKPCHRLIAVHVLRDRLRAELAAVRERCRYANDKPTCKAGCSLICRLGTCGELQRAIINRYPPEIREGVESGGG